ncbi:MAG: lipoyl(octanoyl) transferase LipB [Sphingomonas sp.]|uniref:lipoyl(octanoyl) transferase LipB n=1 Tax=Sphingomonas sp. TaxID=28214 RepID=UPI0025FEAD69|nr:lipoyl(octanoyl) transferase LipB [Sphingomonas sp.]MBX9860804.1 lipoyl(octanoyl) transferase LipB [Sphingomonas sp.]MBY0282923.1 lipoyl(octanoyl) transferase LipB [Sphingomonas sp.]
MTSPRTDPDTDGGDDIEWRISTDPVPYPEALAMMEARAAAVAAGSARELIWLLEHPPIYTAGTSADPAELIDPRFPVFATGRGGRYTYHGPGQRVGYLVLDLAKRGRDIRNFIGSLENWLIEALGLIDVAAYAVPGRVGIWTSENGTEAKIGAIGVRVRRWVTMHGFSVNIATELSDFAGIVPCGLPEFPVTSVKKLGKGGDFKAFDTALVSRLGHFLDSLSLSIENEA